MKRILTVLALTFSPIYGQAVLDLLEGHRDAEQIDPNAHLRQPEPVASSAGAEAKEEKVILQLAPEWSGSSLDSLWAHAVFFQDARNPIVQSIALTGVLHSQGAWGEVKSGRERENVSQTGTRRLRLGARMKAFYNTEITAIADIDQDGRQEDLYELKAKTRVAKRTDLTIGKFRPSFGYESRDGHDLPVPERSLAGNLTLPEQSLGATLTNEFNTWSLTGGYFSGELTDGLGEFNGEGHYFFSANGLIPSASGYSLARRWHVDYIYNTAPRDNRAISQAQFGQRPTNSLRGDTLSNPMFRHLFSAGIEAEQGRWGGVADLVYGRGDETLYGLLLQGTYWALPGTLQVVGRAQYARASGEDTLVQGFGLGTDPTEQLRPYAAGDEFYSVYLGTNLHIYQDKLKILSGVEYSRLIDNTDDETAEGLLFHTAARLAF